MIAYGGWQVLAGTSSPGMFFSFVAALLFAYQPLKNLAKLHTQVQEGLAAAERIYAVLDRAPRIARSAGRRPILRSAPARSASTGCASAIAPAGRLCAGSTS